MSDTQNLGTHVEPSLDASRLDRQWSQVRAGTTRVARLRPVLRISSIALVAAAAVLLFTLGRSSSEAPTVTLAEGSVIETADDASHALLVDGSEVSLSPATRLEVAQADEESDVEVVLARGAATFEVTRNPRRTFTVRAGEVRVVVVGTRFSVTRGAEGAARVEVERGIVEVHRGSEVTRLTAGQSWIEETRVAAPEVVVPDVPADPEVEAHDTLAPAPIVHSVDAHTDARGLFESAREARRDGDAAEAERLYVLLLAQHPRDPRAGVVAFELGRLRMDVLGDDEGALVPLARSIRGRAAASYREDAMARIAVAEDRLGRAHACAESRDGYLSEFPTGVHTAVVSALCR